MCIRQLRYSGMMETAKIRKAGYSIRHTYGDFVIRYRFLIPGITTKIDQRVAATKICSEVLKTMPNYALGKTKIFLKEQHDSYLETIRTEIFMRSIAIIQRGFRRVIFKKFMKRHREAVIVMQKHWRAHGYRKRFFIMQNGFHRLQSLILSREASDTFSDTRKSIIGLQSRCRGFLTRKNLSGKMTEKSHKMAEFAKLRVQEEQQLKRAGNKNYKEEAELRFLTRLANLNRELKIDKEQELKKQYSVNIDEDNKVVDDVFGFLTELQTPKMKHKQKSIRSPSVRVSKMISYLEEKSRHLRKVPSKLLSRPVTYYDSSTRL